MLINIIHIYIYIYIYIYVCIQNCDNVTMYYCMYFYYIIACNVLHISLYVSRHVHNIA